MSKSKNTYPELIAQKLLDEIGVQYTLHNKNLPGTPDIFIKNLKLAIFVHGCFWHKHSCQKINKDDQIIIDKDVKTIEEIKELGYIPIILWECDLIKNQIQAKSKLKYLINKLSNQFLAEALE